MEFAPLGGRDAKPPERLLERLVGRHRDVGGDAGPEAIRTEVYEVGKARPFESLRDWFKALYEILLGTSQGPAWAASLPSMAPPTAAG